MDINELKEKVLGVFRCQHCGACCKRDGYVYVTESEITAIASFLKMDRAIFQRECVFRENGWYVLSSKTFQKNCYLNSDNQCEIYSCRPRACKTYPEWSDVWMSEETVLDEARECPALKTAVLQCR